MKLISLFLFIILLTTSLTYKQVDAKCVLPIIVNKFGFSNCGFPPDIAILDEDGNYVYTSELRLVSHSNYTINVHVGNSGKTHTVPFYLILQIKDEDGIVQELKWIQETIRPEIQSQNFKIPWVPQKAGNYIIQPYMWSDLEVPEILTTPFPLSVEVIGLEALKNTRMELVAYGSYNPGSVEGHFIKGKLKDGSGRPITNGNITILVDSIVMGSTVTDPEGCFDFNNWDNNKLLEKISNAEENHKSALELRFTAKYAGNEDHKSAHRTKISTLYLFPVPLIAPSYETSVSPSTIQVEQGKTVEFQVKVKPLSNEVEVEHMSPYIERLPCGVSYGFRDAPFEDSKVSLDHAGIFKISLHAEKYAKPGTYFLELVQDIAHQDNPYIHDATLGSVTIRILASK